MHAILPRSIQFCTIIFDNRLDENLISREIDRYFQTWSRERGVVVVSRREERRLARELAATACLKVIGSYDS